MQWNPVREPEDAEVLLLPVCHYELANKAGGEKPEKRIERYCVKIAAGGEWAQNRQSPLLVSVISFSFLPLAKPQGQYVACRKRDKYENLQNDFIQWLNSVTTNTTMFPSVTRSIMWGFHLVFVYRVLLRPRVKTQI